MGRRNGQRSSVTSITLLNHDGSVKSVFKLNEKGQLDKAAKAALAASRSAAKQCQSFKQEQMPLVVSSPEPEVGDVKGFAEIFEQMEMATSDWRLGTTNFGNPSGLDLGELANREFFDAGIPSF